MPAVNDGSLSRKINRNEYIRAPFSMSETDNT